MSRFIDYAISHARLTIATLMFLLGAGLVAYVTIPKEAEPDVKIPIIYVQLSQRGISPEDSERLLLRPVETQLKSVGNVKEMRSTAFEGGGFVLLEFEAGFNSKSALADVRAKVDQAKHDLPRDVDEPQVLEVNLSLYPVLVVGLSGDVPERTLLRIARAAKNAIEQAPGVLSAELRGARDEAVEIIVEPTLMKSYGMSLDQLGSLTQSFNTLIAAGALEGETGRFAVKVPSLFEKPQDILKMPVIASPKASVTLLDIGAGQADLQGRDLGHARQRPAGDDHRGVEAHRRQPDRDGRRGEVRRSRSCRRPGRKRCTSPSPRTSRRSSGRCSATCRTRSPPACCWWRSSSCSRSASAPRCSSASRSRRRSWPACSACSSPG